MSTLKIVSLTKQFKGHTALSEVNLNISSGSFVSLLGPSGCGKTTLLRCVAGLETPTSGSILISGEDVTNLPPESRRVGMMFQSYALFPHMTVLENVRFGLRMLGGQSTREQRLAAKESLEVVRMAHLADRMPSQLSGGQQQRVALARAIAHKPRLLLLDEPLSNLDARLREDMQIELLELHRRLGLTTIFVTHDQEEAMSLSDTIVLMNSGQVEQIGTPEEIYQEPATRFAADFMGAANMLQGQVVDGEVLLSGAADTKIPAPHNARSGSGTLALRQEALQLFKSQPEGFDSAVPVNISTRVYRGADMVYVVKIGEVQLRVVSPVGQKAIETGDGWLAWNANDTRWYAGN